MCKHTKAHKTIRIPGSAVFHSVHNSKGHKRQEYTMPRETHWVQRLEEVKK